MHKPTEEEKKTFARFYAEKEGTTIRQIRKTPSEGRERNRRIQASTEGLMINPPIRDNPPIIRKHEIPDYIRKWQPPKNFWKQIPKKRRKGR